MQSKLYKHAFTMIELIFVIIIIGILVAVALPRFSGVENQAVIASGRSTVMSVRAAISTERQKRFMLGGSSYITRLDSGVLVNGVGVKIFDNNGTVASSLLTYPVITKNVSGGWMKIGIYSYDYYVDTTPVLFTYNNLNGTFTCVTNNTTAGKDCAKLSQ